MPTAITFNTLFGSESKVGLVGDVELDDKMEFSFSGFNAVFMTGMGGRGHQYQLEGLIRTSTQASKAAAVSAMNSQLDTIYTHKNNATVLDFTADSGDMAVLIKGSAGSQLANVVIESFALTGPRKYAKVASNFIVTTPFAMTLRKLV